jgi:hypothetical protein
MWVRPRTYTKLENLKGASLKYALALPANIRLGWKNQPGASLLGQLVSYEVLGMIFVERFVVQDLYSRHFIFLATD